MSFIKTIINVSGAINKSIRGRFSNSSELLINLSQHASILDRIEKTNSEQEKERLRKKLEKVVSERDVITDNITKDRELASQAWDRVGREIGIEAQGVEGRMATIHSPSDNPLKAKGDRYERSVGKHLENLGYFVFYNGILRGKLDSGIDIVAFNKATSTVEYIQCKNYQNMVLNERDLEIIIAKMKAHHVTPTIAEIQLQYEKGLSGKQFFDDSIYYDINYCLYVPRERSIDSKLWSKLKGGGEFSLNNTKSFKGMDIYILDVEKSDLLSQLKF